MADEGIELKSPFPVVPPLKDSKWSDLPSSADGESRPVEPPKKMPDIGEEHPCPFFVGGPDLNFVKPKSEPQDDEEDLFYQYLNECLHGVAWECVSQHSREISKEMYSALISDNPKKFAMDKETTKVLAKKIFKKINDPNWSEPCEPIDRIKFDVLSCQTYKLSKARYTVTNDALSEFHRKKVAQATTQRLINIYTSDMEKKLKKLDSKEIKQHPPRMPS
ncbi:hypothetical protein JTE90_024007 [Oedothorax gibbosus]|uniref:Uncharacterized protein n=1 Tax=Oedothorax gibbosus TaxID=931172 RepID=A0AAV6VAZ6_9ARAC|nr:hypothetical protein JTE90_024007 [Oedothorax gibbosus]